MKTDSAKLIILDLFREETLILAGLCTVYEVPDDFVHKTMKNLEILMDRYVRRIERQDRNSIEETPIKRTGVPHPAVASMLNEIERFRSVSSHPLRETERVTDE